MDNKWNPVQADHVLKAGITDDDCNVGIAQDLNSEIIIFHINPSLLLMLTRPQVN